MPELEKDIERKACTWAREQGWIVYKFTSPQRRSVPDRIFLRNGRTVFIEFKRPGGRLTPMQARELRKLQNAGFMAEVAWSVEDAKAWLTGEKT